MSREVCGICWCPYDDVTGACGCEPAQEQVWVCPDSAEHRYQKPGHCEDCGKTLMQERHFCPRCGKRTDGIHTCTPPQEDHFCDTYCTWADHAPGCVRAEPVQEPVAWIHADPDKPRVRFLEWRENEPGYCGQWIKTPLYTAPPRCPNCASLQDQNTKLDRKLAELEAALRAQS